MNWLQLSCISSIIGNLGFVIGDILIVGFLEEPEKYPLLSNDYASRIKFSKLSYFMLSGSTKRLFWGAVSALFANPFLIGGLYLQSFLYQGLPKWLYYLVMAISVITR